MSATDDAIADVNERLGLTMRAQVLTGTTWSTVARADLPCSLSEAPRAPAATGAGRTELASRGVFEWSRDWIMPAGARVTVDKFGAQKWAIVSNTTWPSFGPGGGVLSYSCEVVRAN